MLTGVSAPLKARRGILLVSRRCCGSRSVNCACGS